MAVAGIEVARTGPSVEVVSHLVGNLPPVDSSEEVEKDVGLEQQEKVTAVKKFVASISMLSGAREILVLVARGDKGSFVASECSHGLEPERLSGLNWPLHQGIAGKVFSTREPKVFDTPLSDPKEYGVFVDPKILNAAVFPIVHTTQQAGEKKQESIGVLLVLDKRGGDGEREALTETELKLIQSRTGLLAYMLIETDLYKAKTAEVDQIKDTLKCMQNGVAGINSEGEIFEINPAFAEHLRTGEVLGTHYRQAFVRHLEFLRTRVDQVFATGLSDSTDIPFVDDDDGTPVTLEIQIDPVKRGDGKSGAVIVVNRARQVVSQEQQLALAGSLSHEARNPLTVVIGMAQTALSIDDPEFNKEALQMILTNARKAHRSLDDGIDTSKLANGGSLSCRNAPVKLRELLETLMSDIRSLNTTKVVIGDLEYVAEMEEITSDPDRISQIAANFLTNAIKYSPSGKENTVRVVVTQEDQNLRIAVKDQGMGIPADQVDQLFQQYFRVDTEAHREQKGTGLGLHLCKAISRVLGGEIGVESVWTEGSTFWFTLPIR